MREDLVWLVWSLGLLVVWSCVFLVYRKARKRMFWASLLTLPFGFSEPLFVPRYWYPPSVFDLARRTGFDFESLIFCFGIGGLGIVLYDLVFKVEHEQMSSGERHDPRHRYHLWTLVSPVIIFPSLYVLTGWNPIYIGILTMFTAGLAALWCRPDLKKKIWMGGAIFLLFYFIYFFLLELLNPGFVERVWNLPALSGVLVLGVPLEELLFAFTFGMLWSSYYEHINWLRITTAR